MRPEDFNEGDNWNEPFRSGYDVLWERIVEDMEANPEEYKPWERGFFLEMPPRSYPEYESDMRAYIEQWCEERSDDDEAVNY